MQLRLKNKYNKKLPSNELCKNRWIFFELAEWVDGFILKRLNFISNFYI